MDVQQKLDEIVAVVGNARSMPMSASCVVNRAELLAMLGEVREALPGSLAQAQELLGGRERMVAEAQQEAQRIIESAQAQSGSLISDTEVARRSQEEADRILSGARREAEEICAEADDYVDSKLANFEVVLSKTIGSVDRGREKLLGRHPHAEGVRGADGYGEEYDEAPERSADPQELRNRADAYVEAQFRAFEAVLSKTLEAVGRGRQKLLGHRPADDLTTQLLDDQSGHPDSYGADSDYLAGLAGLQETTPPPSAPPFPPATEPAAVPYAPAAEYQQPGYAEQDPYAFQQQQFAAPAGPGTEAPSPYATASAGYLQEGYGAREGYVSPEYGAQDAGYGWQSPSPYEQRYDPPLTGYGTPPQSGALDETSLFDTGLIDAEQLRQYEQGR